MSTTTPDFDALRTRLADRYSLGHELGRGGMGAVYLARDLQLDRSVAIKVLPSEFAAQSDLRERFLRETRTAASFSHPNIVPVFSIEDRGDVLAMAMGYVEGESLGERVRRAGPLSVKETVRLLQDVGYALAYAHGRSVVHRDIKPDNIMFERATGRALVMDFGIARSITPVQHVDAGLTRVGEVVGTPEFMSPEQASGDRVDGRSDLYSLGLVAWFAVTGAFAISGESTQKVLVKQLTETVPPVATARAGLPAPLSDAIDRLLRKDPEERFPTAEALVEAIDAAQLGAPEIPLPMRLFQQNSKTHLVNASFVVALAAVNWLRADAGADIDRLTTLSLGVALEVVLLVTITRQARTLRSLGFDHRALRAGLRAIMAEGDEARAQALAVPGVARRRRMRNVAAIPLSLIGAMQLWAAVTSRVETSPGDYAMTKAAATMGIGGICAMVVSLVLLAIDPFRRPLVQRIANALWSGPIGARLMGASGRNESGSDATLPNMAAQQRAAPVLARSAAPASSSTDDRLTRIEERLATLERRRT